MSADPGAMLREVARPWSPDVPFRSERARLCDSHSRAPSCGLDVLLPGEGGMTITIEEYRRRRAAEALSG